MNDVVEARCRQSFSLIGQIQSLMPEIKPCCRRHDFAACAIDLALEHHRAIVVLIENAQLGTGTALIRPLIEASASAFWLAYAASDEEILALPTDRALETSDHDIPMLGELLEKLKPYFPAISVLSNGLSRKGTRTARWLHKYTHGGTPQLLRRDQAGGWLEGEIVLTLLRADLFALLGASVLTVLYDSDEFRELVFGQRDALGVELSEMFGTEAPEKQPRKHPAPEKKCCGEPLFLKNQF